MHARTRSEVLDTNHLNASVITALRSQWQGGYTELNCCRMEVPGNCGSVSLTSVPRMTVEQIVLGDISKHLRDTKVTENSWCYVALPRANLWCEGWLSRGRRAVCAVDFGFSDAFSVTSHGTLTIKLVKCGAEKCSVRWGIIGWAVEYNRCWSPVQSPPKCGWLLVVLLRDTYGAKTRNALIDDLDEVTQCTQKDLLWYLLGMGASILWKIKLHFRGAFAFFTIVCFLKPRTFFTQKLYKAQRL